MAVAIGVVASGVAAATRSGWRQLDGDLGGLPAALAASTGHGATHLIQSALLRSYTSGVATVPLVIAPYSWWAWRTLRRRISSAAPLRAVARPSSVAGWRWRSWRWARLPDARESSAPEFVGQRQPPRAL